MLRVSLGHRTPPKRLRAKIRRHSAFGHASMTLRTLEEENRKLKQLVADLSLDKKMLQDVLSKKL
jgi:putative transposase